MDPQRLSVAAFDFDGTLIRRDSMLSFLAYVAGPGAYRRGLWRLSPTLLGYGLGRVPRQQAKEQLLTYFLGGMEASRLYDLGEQFAEENLRQWERPAGMARLRVHQSAGDRCVLVTASLPFWTQAWAQAHGLTLLASKPELINGRFTGRLNGANNYGPEKVRRLEAWLDGQKPIRTLAYGDSAGDRELLTWADEAFFKPFRHRV
jgi:phosphatidylglycerophosphatase C